MGATKPLTKARLPVTGNFLFTTWKRRENLWTNFTWILSHSEVSQNTPEHDQQSQLSTHPVYAPLHADFS